MTAMMIDAMAVQVAGAGASVIMVPVMRQDPGGYALHCKALAHARAVDHASIIEESGPWAMIERPEVCNAGLTEFLSRNG